MATPSSILAWRIPWTDLVGCSPWGHKESDTTEHAHTHIYKTISSIVSSYLKQYNCLFLYFIYKEEIKKGFNFIVLKLLIIKKYCLLLILLTMPIALLFILFVEPREGKARARRLEEDGRSCRN